MARPLTKARDRKFWNVEPAKTDDGSPAGELFLYGMITEEKWDESDVTPFGMVQSLNALGDISELNVHLFSEGGSVFAGNAIYHMLSQRKETVNIYIEGLAASIASVIAMAGDRTYIARNAMFYIHNVMNFMIGLYNKTDLQKMITELDRVSDVTIRAYEDKTGMTPEKIKALLDANGGDGTWLNAEQAVAMGFCDAITPTVKTPMEAVAMVRPKVYSFKGHEIDLSMYKNAPDLTNAERKGMNGGSKKVASTAKPKAARRGKFRAELIGTVCPHCGGINQLDPTTGIVSPDPAEGATVAVPMDDTVEMREGKRYRNEIWRITCVHCGEEYEYDSDPAGAVSTGIEEPVFNPDEPIIQASRTRKAKRTAPVKASRKRGARMEGEDTIPDNTGAPTTVDVVCTECNTAFTVDIDPAIEEAIVVCPNCQAELTVDTSGAAGGTASEPATDEEVIVAFRKGMANERRRATLLNERKKAFPQFADAIDGFIRNGSSVDCANNWIFQALAANPAQTAGNQAYRAAARRDAQVLNRLGSPARGDERANTIAANFDSLAERRGTRKNA